jgi:hypothetical protein
MWVVKCFWIWSEFLSPPKFIYFPSSILKIRINPFQKARSSCRLLLNFWNSWISLFVSMRKYKDLFDLSKLLEVAIWILMRSNLDSNRTWERLLNAVDEKEVDLFWLCSINLDVSKKMRQLENKWKLSANRINQTPPNQNSLSSKWCYLFMHTISICGQGWFFFLLIWIFFWKKGANC